MPDGGVPGDAYRFSVIYQATTYAAETQEAGLELVGSDPVFAGDTATLSVKALTVDPILEMNLRHWILAIILYDLEAQSVLTVTLNNAGQGPLRVLGFDWREMRNQAYGFGTNISF